MGEETPRIELQRTIDCLTVIEGLLVKTGARNSMHYLRPFRVFIGRKAEIDDGNPEMRRGNLRE